MPAIPAAVVVAVALLVGCGGEDEPPEPETVQDAVTLGVLQAAKQATFGTSQLAREFCDLDGVTTAEVRARTDGEPPLKFKCTLTFSLANDPTTSYSVDYRTTLDAEGCFRGFEIPGSKVVNRHNEFGTFGAPGSFSGCVDLPED
jgi:hypothetical protein